MKVRNDHLFLCALAILLIAGCGGAGHTDHGHSHGDGHEHEAGHEDHGHSHGDDHEREAGHDSHGDDAHDHGHDHGDGSHDHGGGGEGETASYTLFSDSHELFVELDVPVAGEEHAYHAHVTRLEDNMAARTGRFRVEFLPADGTGRAVRTLVAEEIARRGIFTPEGPAPKRPGSYRLVFHYEGDTGTATWDAGVIEVGEKEPIVPEGALEGETTFLKETSWTIPFRIRQPRREKVARSVSIPARVEADPRLTASISAPGAGRVLWSAGDETTFEGRSVEAGVVLGRLVPSSSFGSWHALELELRRARIELDHATSELERVESLVQEGLLPDRRLAEARTARRKAVADYERARREQEGRTGTAHALDLVAPTAGVVLEILLEDGETAEAGQTVARIASDDQVLVRGILRGATPSELNDVAHAHVRPREESRSVDLLEEGGVLLGRARLVDPKSSGVPVTWSLENDGRLLIGELVELVLGLGARETHLTVPNDAVVEINTRPYLFIQKTGESFERRRVVLGPSSLERVAVLEGVAPDEYVVTEGAFDVYMASLAGTVQSHQH